MAGRKTLAITQRQFEVLRVMWDHGPQTVRDLLERLPRGESAPYTTVLGLLQNMEKAGLVRHEKEGLAHRYAPLVSRRQATTSLVSDFVTRFFQDSAEQVVLGLVDGRHLSPKDLRAIEERLERAERGEPGPVKPSPRARKRAPKRRKPR